MTQEKREISQMVIETVLAQGLSLNRLNYVVWLKETGKIHDNCPLPAEWIGNTSEELKTLTKPVCQTIEDICITNGLDLNRLGYVRWLKENEGISDYYHKQLSFL